MRLRVGVLAALLALTCVVDADQGLRSRQRGSGTAGGSAAACSDCFLEVSFLSADGWTVDVDQKAVVGNVCPGTAPGFDSIQAGVDNGGDWDTTDGGCDSVKTTSNYALGRGGRGHRTMIGNGHNNDSGGLIYDFAETALSGGKTDALYMRMYKRWEAGMVIGFPANGANQKIIYFDGSSCGFVGGCYVLLEEGNIRFTSNGNNSNNTLSAWGWTNLHGGVNSATGNWSCWQFELHNETSDAANDGIVKVWVDGVQRFQNLAVNYITGTLPTGFSGVHIPSNGNFSLPNDMYNDHDDLAFSAVSMPACF
jgi:hypothetical protein